MRILVAGRRRLGLGLLQFGEQPLQRRGLVGKTARGIGDGAFGIAGPADHWFVTGS